MALESSYTKSNVDVEGLSDGEGLLDIGELSDVEAIIRSASGESKIGTKVRMEERRRATKEFGWRGRTSLRHGTSTKLITFLNCFVVIKDRTKERSARGPMCNKTVSLEHQTKGQTLEGTTCNKIYGTLQNPLFAKRQCGLQTSPDKLGKEPFA
jgi:hypothetical protein